MTTPSSANEIISTNIEQVQSRVTNAVSMYSLARIIKVAEAVREEKPVVFDIFR